MSEVEKALADVKQEGADPFADMGKDTPADPPPAETTVDEPIQGEPKVEEPAASTEENIPFHKHPRWIEREQELKSLRETEEAHAKEIEELKAFREETKSSNPTIPDWFRELYGDNEVAWNKYNEHEKVRTQEIETSVLQRQEEARKREADQATRWNKWVDDEIGKLQSDGKQFDRNKLIKTMLEYRPTDERGNFDFQKGYRIYEALEPKNEADPLKSQARKQLADITNSSKGEKKAKDYMTTADLRNKSWNSL